MEEYINCSEEGIRSIKQIYKLAHEFILANEDTLADDWQTMADIYDLIHTKVKDQRLPKVVVREE